MSNSRFRCSIAAIWPAIASSSRACTIKSIPKLVARESRSIVQRLADLTRARYNKFGNTVFHLEPNVKDGPGGLRDYNLACWLALISAIEEKAGWPDEAELLPPGCARPSMPLSIF